MEESFLGVEAPNADGDAGDKDEFTRLTSRSAAVKHLRERSRSSSAGGASTKSSNSRAKPPTYNTRSGS